MRLTAAEGGWRIVIVDGADEMNRNAANALLKILEEPPRQALLLLVSHSPGRLLPTIRSRCRQLAADSRSRGRDGRAAAWRSYRPDLGRAMREALARLAEGSIGRALELADAGGLGALPSALGVLRRLPRSTVGASTRFADKLARADAEEAYRRSPRLAVAAGSRAWWRRAAGGGEARARSCRARGRRCGASPGARGLDRWVEVWENRIAPCFRPGRQLNLDRKQVVLGAFFALENWR